MSVIEAESKPDHKRRPPKIQELLDNPDLFKKLDPQVQLWTLDLLKQTPTPSHAVKKGDKPSDPRKFITDVLGWKPSPAALRHGITSPITPDQDRVLQSVVKYHKTAVTAAKGVGKTKILAAIILWFYETFGPRSSALTGDGSLQCYVVTTSASWDLLETVLWGEIKNNFICAAQPLTGTCLNLEIQSGYPKWKVVSLSTRVGKGDMSATRFHGFHAPYVLVAIDEATELSEELWEGAEGIALDAVNTRIVAVANPTDPTSPFRKRCQMESWNHLEISAWDHPNVVYDDPAIIPGCTAKSAIDDEILKHGEGSPGYMAFVLGKWPDTRGNAVIPLGVYEKTLARYERWLETPPDDDHRGIALGLDVAREGNDMTILYACHNGILQPVRVSAVKDTTKIEGMVISYINEVKARAIALDDTGVGGGITDHLKEKQRAGLLPPPGQLRIMPLNFGQSAFAIERFNRLKDQLWWEMSKDMEAEKLAHPSDKIIRQYLQNIPNTTHIADQFTRPIYDFDTRARIDVLDKREVGNEKTTSLPAKSPDFAHAAMLARFAWSILAPIKVEEVITSTDQAIQNLLAEGLRKEIQKYNNPQPRYRRRWLS
jgi:phage terminase large subunit